MTTVVGRAVPFYRLDGLFAAAHGLRQRLAQVPSGLLVLTFVPFAFAAEYIKAVDGGFGAFSILSSGGTAALFFLAGLVARAQLRGNRMWALLVLMGFFCASEDYFLSNNRLIFTIGAVFASSSSAMMMHVVLAFPSGRLSGRRDRAIVALGWIGAVGFSTQSNLFWIDGRSYLHVELSQSLSAASGHIATAIQTVCLFAIGIIVSRRWLAATPVRRRDLGPYIVAWTALGWSAVVCNVCALANGRFGLPVTAPALFTFLDDNAGVLMPFVFLYSVVALRLRRGELSARVLALGERVTPRSLRTTLAEVLGDGSLRVLIHHGDEAGYRDEHGAAVVVPEQMRGLRMTPVRCDGELVGALIHDEALDEEPGLVATAADCAGRALAAVRERERAQRERADAADAARRQVGRDLHDGAQQRLVALALELGGAHGRLSDRLDPEVRELLERASGELAGAVADLRSLANGVYPPALVERGLDAALDELVERMPITVSLRAGVGRRLEIGLEATAYFVVAEAVTNALKHSGAEAIVATVSADDRDLRITVADDGVGGADPRGSGLAGLAERVRSCGGSLTVESPPRGGTRVTATLPVRERASV